LFLVNDVVKNEISFNASSSQTASINLVIQDILGNTLWNRRYTVADKTREIKIDLSSFPDGIYFITASSPYTLPARFKVVKIE
jgi:hypothetical protein